MPTTQYEKPAISEVIADPGGDIEERAVSSWILVGTAAVAAVTWIVATTRVKKRPVRPVRPSRGVLSGYMDDEPLHAGFSGDDAVPDEPDADGGDASPLTVITIPGRH